MRTVIGMAHGLGLEVVAEGVETPEEHGFLREEGCNDAQGYLFSRPVPADCFETWYIVNRRRDARMLRERLRDALLELPTVAHG